MEMEEKFILDSLQKIRKKLFMVENKFNNATDPILIDSYIYELKALHMQHKFYMKLCKEKEIKFI